MAGPFLSPASGSRMGTWAARPGGRSAGLPEIFSRPHRETAKEGWSLLDAASESGKQNCCGGAKPEKGWGDMQRAWVLDDIHIFMTHSKNYSTDNTFWAPVTYGSQKGLFIAKFMQACLERKSENLGANLERTRSTFTWEPIWYQNQTTRQAGMKKRVNVNGVRAGRWGWLSWTSKDNLEPQQSPKQARQRCQSHDTNTEKVMTQGRPGRFCPLIWRTKATVPSPWLAGNLKDTRRSYLTSPSLGYWGKGRLSWSGPEQGWDTRKT